MTIGDLYRSIFAGCSLASAVAFDWAIIGQLVSASVPGAIMECVAMVVGSLLLVALAVYFLAEG